MEVFTEISSAQNSIYLLQESEGQMDSMYMELNSWQIHLEVHEHDE